jgi:hypothetical protein
MAQHERVLGRHDETLITYSIRHAAVGAATTRVRRGHFDQALHALRVDKPYRALRFDRRVESNGGDAVGRELERAEWVPSFEGSMCNNTSPTSSPRRDHERDLLDNCRFVTRKAQHRSAERDGCVPIDGEARDRRNVVPVHRATVALDGRDRGFVTENQPYGCIAIGTNARGEGQPALPSIVNA